MNKKGTSTLGNFRKNTKVKNYKHMKIFYKDNILKYI